VIVRFFDELALMARDLEIFNPIFSFDPDSKRSAVARKFNKIDQSMFHSNTSFFLC
jgi:hypothetical protein